MASLLAGSYIVLWLGEIMTERGIGNGVSLIIFAGIISRIPVSFAEVWQLITVKSLSVWSLIGEVLGVLVLLILVIYAYQSERRIPVQYAKRIVGRKVYGGQTTYIPLRLIQAGVITYYFCCFLLWHFLQQLVNSGQIPGLIQE